MDTRLIFRCAGPFEMPLRFAAGLLRASGVGERDLCASDGAEAPGAGALGELHRAVQAVVVGEGQRLVAQLQRSQDDLFDVGGAFEEGEVGVGVEFGVGW